VLHLLNRRARRRRFEAQLPEALDRLARHLRAGDPLGATLAAVAREMPDPLGAEFAIVADEMSYGCAPDAALERLIARVDLPDLRCLAIAVRLRSGPDRDLAPALDRLAGAMRERSGTGCGRRAARD
jgi:tight adherence protein B